MNCMTIADIADQLNLQYGSILNNIQEKRMLKKGERSRIFLGIIEKLFDRHSYTLGYRQNLLGRKFFKGDVIRAQKRIKKNSLKKLKEEEEKKSSRKNKTGKQLDLFFVGCAGMIKPANI